MNNERPSYPLAKEQKAAVLRATQEGADSGAIRAIQRFWDAKRHELDPLWRDRYNAEIEKWAESQAVRFSQYRENAVGC